MKRTIRILRNYRAARLQGSGFWDALGSAIYLASPKPPLPQYERTGDFDMTRCECGHFMGDHQPDPDGHGTLCISCKATMRHRPVSADAKLWPEVIGQ